MKVKDNWFKHIKNLYEEFSLEQSTQNAFEIVGVKKDLKGDSLFVIKIHGHQTKSMTAQQIILNDSIVDGLSSRAVRALTYFAVLEKLAPDNKLISWELDQLLNEYCITIENREKKVSTISASIASKNKSLINKMTPEEANRIGYMAGINDTLRENF